MKHGAQSQCLALDNVIVATAEEVLVAINGLQNLVAVENQGVCLVPGLIQSVAPIFSSILIGRQVLVVAPYTVVAADGVGTAHHLDHLYRERLTVERSTVQIDINAIEHFLIAFLRLEKFALRNLVVRFYLQPVVTRNHQRAAGYNH